MTLSSLVHKIEIPETMGTIRERYEAPQSGSPVIIHIQDAHAHYEAQQNIQKILGELTQKNGIDLIFIEGAMDRLEADRLRYFKKENLNRELVDLLAKQGVVSGAEMFLYSVSFPRKRESMDPRLKHAGMTKNV